ncbi:MAG TPA: lysophospholipid acyltransferase family protein [Microthrixaceae bacterium]|jgi:1-acyl-sn-glycerol-3-phosphate acyltransferase|nr:lysophospholipid acyltransferase family protein [Microthrixaceae bacterium]HQF93785.1 lysophospholipid acyltransferase family protein [Microthrixaceae bacterium]
MTVKEAGQIQGLAKAVLSPVFKFAWRVRTEGLEKVPASGGAILAPNHTSVLDSFFLPLVVGRAMTYVGKAEYMDDWKTKYLFPAMGMIPIDRSGGDASSRALDAAVGVLERGELFGIYPEGTRSRSGKLHKGHTGVARIALRANAPIVPVGIIGAVEVQPPDAKFPRPFMEVLIRFGDPIDVSRYRDRANDRLVLRQLTDELMYSIRDLSGQEYVDTYATKTHETMPAESTHIVTPEPNVEALPPLVEKVPSLTTEAAQPRSSTAVLQSRPLVDLSF